METNPTRNHEVAGLISGLDQWVKDLALLWLWCRLAALAPIRPLDWERPYAAGAALKKRKKEIPWASGHSLPSFALKKIPWSGLHPLDVGEE